MCGYCIEGAVVLDFVQQEVAGLEVELDTAFVVNYLQETVYLPERLQQCQGMSQFPYAIEVVLCRAWGDALWQGRSDTVLWAERAEPPRVSWRPGGVSQTVRVCSVS